MARKFDCEQLLTPGETARVFRVDPKTVLRWAHEGRLSTLRTAGGHRRFRATEVNALLYATDSKHSSDREDTPTSPWGTA